MERKTRIKAVAAALTAVFLASIALASLAFGASSNAAGTGTYQSFVLSKNSQVGAWHNLVSGWQTTLSISLPYVGIAGWYNVECDAYAYLQGTYLGIGIGVDTPGSYDTTIRYIGDIVESATSLKTGVHTQNVFYLGPGAHTFHFRAGKISGTGPWCSLQHRSITVTFFTDGYVSFGAAADAGAGPTE